MAASLPTAETSIATRSVLSCMLDATEPRTRAWRGAEIPAAGGTGNARSVARVHSALACGRSPLRLHVVPRRVEWSRAAVVDLVGIAVDVQIREVSMNSSAGRDGARLPAKLVERRVQITCVRRNSSRKASQLERSASG